MKKRQKSIEPTRNYGIKGNSIITSRVNEIVPENFYRVSAVAHLFGKTPDYLKNRLKYLGIKITEYNQAAGKRKTRLKKYLAGNENYLVKTIVPISGVRRGEYLISGKLLLNWLGEYSFKGVELKTLFNLGNEEQAWHYNSVLSRLARRNPLGRNAKRQGNKWILNPVAAGMVREHLNLFKTHYKSGQVMEKIGLTEIQLKNAREFGLLTGKKSPIERNDYFFPREEVEFLAGLTKEERQAPYRTLMHLTKQSKKTAEEFKGIMPSINVKDRYVLSKAIREFNSRSSDDKERLELFHSNLFKTIKRWTYLGKPSEAGKLVEAYRGFSEGTHTLNWFNTNVLHRQVWQINIIEEEQSR